MIFSSFCCTSDVCSNSDLSVKIQNLAVNLFVMSVSRQSSKVVHSILLQWENCSDSTSFSLSVQHLGVAVSGWALPPWNILGSASQNCVVLPLRFLMDYIHDSIYQKRGYLSSFVEITFLLQL